MISITTKGINIGTYVWYNNAIYVVDGIKDYVPDQNIHLSNMYENGFFKTFDETKFTLATRDSLENYYRKEAEYWKQTYNVKEDDKAILRRLGYSYKAFGGPINLPTEDLEKYIDQKVVITRIPHTYDIRIMTSDGVEFNVPFFCLEVFTQTEAEKGDSVILSNLLSVDVKNMTVLSKQIIYDGSGKPIYSYQLQVETDQPLTTIKSIYK